MQTTWNSTIFQKIEENSKNESTQHNQLMNDTKKQLFPFIKK